MRTAVVGHVEWVQFARVERVPAPGEIVRALEVWEEAAGGGAVAAVQLARLARECTLFTALGEDDLGRRARERLSELGVRVCAAPRAAPQRRAFTFVDAAGERTITVMGARLVPGGGDPLPWEELAAVDCVYFTGGDAEALVAARSARVLVATPRAGDVLREAGVVLDALVGSGADAGERRSTNALEPEPRLAVSTLGPEGGCWVTADGRAGSFDAAAPPGPMGDSYGAGDSFAAGLTHALGAGQPLEEALGFAARCGAWCLAGRGPYEGQLGWASPARET